MNRFRKGAVIALLAALLSGALAWRLWPHPLSAVLSTEESGVTSLACAAAVSGLTEEGSAHIDSHGLQGLTRADPAFGEIIGLLRQSSYRQSFRNLLPRPLTSVRTDSGKTVQLFFAWGDTEQETCFLVICDDATVTASIGRQPGFQVYYASDDHLAERLIACLQQYGV